MDELCLSAFAALSGAACVPIGVRMSAGDHQVIVCGINRQRVALSHGTGAPYRDCAVVGGHGGVRDGGL